MKDLDGSIFEKKLMRLALFLFFLVVFFSFIYPVIDPDTPWHLKTGEYILMNRTIPMSSDPFSFATEKIPFIGRFILSQNWLAQVFLFSIYRSMGPVGLVLLRAVVFTLIISILWYLIYRRKGFLISTLAAGAVTYMLQVHFSSVRPQMFTFLFSAVVILLIEKYRDTRSVKWLYALPFLMLLWANMHGGFVYGIMLIMIYLSGATAEFFLKGRLAPKGEEHLSGRELGLLFVFGVLSVLFSLINPNTYKAFVYIFMTQSPGYNVHNLYSEMIQEYKPPFSLIGVQSALIYCFYACVGGAFIMGIVFIKRRQPTRLLLLIFALTPALIAARYIPLFLIVAAPLLAHVPLGALPEPSTRNKTAVRAAAIVLCSFVAIYSNPFRSRQILRFNNSFHYPVRAANFLLKNNINGNIFASYNTAAYILFRCFPKSKIYLDSRFIDVTRITRGLDIEGAFDSREAKLASINRLVPAGVGKIKISGRGQKGGGNSWNDTKWKKQLDWIGADIIVYAAVNHSSESIVPFVFKLAGDNTWKLIYVDGTVMIFVKDEPKFSNIIARYQISKSRIYDEIVKECIEAGPQGKRYYSSIAVALLLKGMAGKNTEFFINKALARDPRDFIAKYSQVLFALMTHERKKGHARKKVLSRKDAKNAKKDLF